MKSVTIAKVATVKAPKAAAAAKKATAPKAPAAAKAPAAPKADAMAAIVASAPVAAAVAAADVKPARTRRAAQAPVARVESIVAKSAPVIAIKFRLTAARPVAGRPLRAFTHAVLEMLDMFNGKAYDRATLNNIMGTAAINYHIKQTGAMAATADGIIVTPSFGTDFFMFRKEHGEFDPKDVEDFKAILTHGKADGRLIKNQGFIVSM